MRVELHVAHAGWAHLSAAQLSAALPSHVSVGEVPALPLAKALDMPPQAGFARGDLSIRLGGLRVALEGGGSLQIDQAAIADGRCTVELRVAGLALAGTQQVLGTQIWESGIDGAGTSLPYDVQMGGGADDTDKHPTWIATANEQRAALQNLPGGNGATLLSTYSNHRAAFTDVFTLPIARPFQNGWRQPAISQMAQDTNDNVGGGNGKAGNGVINDPAKIYGTTTYNGNAQNQQLALATMLTGMAAYTSPQNPTDPTNPYNQAAAATVSFATTVVQNTNASKVTDVPPHTRDDVYATVQNGSPAASVSVGDVHTLLMGNPIGGRDAQGNAWTMVLSQEERAFVRQLQAEQAEHIARLAAARPVPLAQGALTAQIDCFVSLQFALDGGLRLLDGRVELDGFDLEFDDSGWDVQLGPALAGTAREALTQARFIKSLLHDRVADALERTLVPALSAVLLDAR